MGIGLPEVQQMPHKLAMAAEVYAFVVIPRVYGKRARFSRRAGKSRNRRT